MAVIRIPPSNLEVMTIFRSPKKTPLAFLHNMPNQILCYKKRSCQNQAKHFMSACSVIQTIRLNDTVFIYLWVPSLPFWLMHHSSGSTNHMSQNNSKKSWNKYFTLLYCKLCSSKIVWHKYLIPAICMMSWHMLFSPVSLQVALD